MGSGIRGRSLWVVTIESKGARRCNKKNKGFRGVLSPSRAGHQQISSRKFLIAALSLPSRKTSIEWASEPVFEVICV